MYITQGLHRALQQHPDMLASVCGDRRRTFREFGDRVARLAGALQQLGLKPGERVAMLALNADHYLEYQMAVPWAGGVLNPCNFRWSVAELVYSLNDCEATYLIVDDTFKAMAGPIREQAKTLRAVIFAG
ncbi:MAG TPA: AMP-binding protein, partial [Hydrogenophaga sp.]